LLSDGTGTTAPPFATRDVQGGYGSYRGFRHNQGIAVTVLKGRRLYDRVNWFRFRAGGWGRAAHHHLPKTTPDPSLAIR